MDAHWGLLGACSLRSQALPRAPRPLLSFGRLFDKREEFCKRRNCIRI